MIEVSIHYPTGRIVVGPGEPMQPLSDKVRIEFVLPRKPFMFWSKLHIAEKIQFPKGYGVVYYDPIMAKVLMAPIPFNILIGLLIWLYQWFKFGAGVWFWKYRA